MSACPLSCHWLSGPAPWPPDGKDADHRGYPAIDDDEVVLQQVRTAFGRGWQVLAHVNGDAAIDQFITAVNAATGEAGPADRRVVAVHAQTAREDQVEAFQRLGIIPSFFSMHTFLLGRLVPRHGPGDAAGGDHLTGQMGTGPADDLHLAS